MQRRGSLTVLVSEARGLTLPPSARFILLFKGFPLLANAEESFRLP